MSDTIIFFAVWVPGQLNSEDWEGKRACIRNNFELKKNKAIIGINGIIQHRMFSL